MFEHIRKRDGRIVKFDPSKITSAITKAGTATGELGIVEAEKITNSILDSIHEACTSPIPDVEQVQDIVEKTLFTFSYFKTAKAYILYREQNAQIRTISTK